MVIAVTLVAGIGSVFQDELFLMSAVTHCHKNETPAEAFAIFFSAHLPTPTSLSRVNITSLCILLIDSK